MPGTTYYKRIPFKTVFLWKMELVCDKIVCRIGGLKLGTLLFVLCKVLKFASKKAAIIKGLRVQFQGW